MVERLLAHPALAWLARLALVSPFLVSGVAKLFDVPGAAAEVRSLIDGVPAGPTAAAVIVIQLVGAALVVGGGRLAWVGAALLGGFTIAATVLAHALWTKTGADRAHDLVTFFEHAGLVGGLALAAILSSMLLRRGTP